MSREHLSSRVRREIDHLGDDIVVVTDSGQPVAVLVSVGRWNYLQEQLEDLEDANSVLVYRSSREEGRTAEQVFEAIERQIAR